MSWAVCGKNTRGIYKIELARTGGRHIDDGNMEAAVAEYVLRRGNLNDFDLALGDRDDFCWSSLR